MIGPLPPPLGGQSVLIKSIAESSLAESIGIEVFNVSHLSPPPLRRLQLTIFFVFNFIKLLFDRPSIDLVHIHTSAGLAFWEKTLYIFLTKIFKKKILIHIHGGMFLNFWNNCGKISRRFLVYFLNACSGIIVLSSGGKVFFENIVHVKSPVSILPNAVETHCVLVDRSDNDVKFLYVGHLKPEKGLLDLLLAYESCLKGSGGNISLRIMGAGDTKANERIIRDAFAIRNLTNVSFLGALSGPEKWREFAIADIFVLPSHSEDMPMTLLEAMSCGLPVITTDVGAISSVVTNGENGVLIQPRNLHELAEAMQLLARDQRLRKRMGQENLCKAKREFSMSRYLVDLEKIYRDVLAR